MPFGRHFSRGASVDRANRDWPPRWWGLGSSRDRGYFLVSPVIVPLRDVHAPVDMHACLEIRLASGLSLWAGTFCPIYRLAIGQSVRGNSAFIGSAANAMIAKIEAFNLPDPMIAARSF